MLLALCLCLTLSAAADTAAEARVPEEGICCFSREELDGRSGLQGVFITILPQGGSARILLGRRELRPGDAVAREDLPRLRVEPLAGGEASLCYLPFENGRLGEETVLTFHLERVDTEPPTAEDGSLETWRDLPNRGTLRGSGVGALRFRLENRPTRGTVELNEDGSFVYTPKKNKVGEDSFTFTVSDEAGNVSAPATVRVTIRKPTDARTFADLDRDEQFTAIWLREAGLFGGEMISDRLSFGPARTVSRGDFLAMVMDLAGIDPEIGIQVSTFSDGAEAGAWLQPYLASALRRGFISGEQAPGGLRFRPNDPITRREAAVLTARVLGGEESLPASFTDAPPNL